MKSRSMERPRYLDNDLEWRDAGLANVKQVQVSWIIFPEWTVVHLPFVRGRA